MAANTTHPNLTKPVELTLRAARGNYLLKKHLHKLCKQHINDPKFKDGHDFPELEPLPKDPDSKFSDEDIQALGSVCIIGAGAAGLYAAMLLVVAGVKNFVFLEASERVGGRAYTFNFPEDLDYPCNHNYYDMGAMRIPCIPGMQP